MDGESKIMVYMALSKVENLRKSLDSGCITQKDLRKLSNEKEKANRLLKAANVSLDVGKFEVHLDSLNTYINTVNIIVFHSIDTCIEG